MHEPGCFSIILIFLLLLLNKIILIFTELSKVKSYETVRNVNSSLGSWNIVIKSCFKWDLYSFALTYKIHKIKCPSVVKTFFPSLLCDRMITLQFLAAVTKKAWKKLKEDPENMALCNTERLAWLLQRGRLTTPTRASKSCKETIFLEPQWDQ